MRYMRWTKRLEAIAAYYLREIFELPEEEDIPPVSAHDMVIRGQRHSYYCSTLQSTLDMATFLGGAGKPRILRTVLLPFPSLHGESSKLMFCGFRVCLAANHPRFAGKYKTKSVKLKESTSPRRTS